MDATAPLRCRTRRMRRPPSRFVVVGHVLVGLGVVARKFVRVRGPTWAWSFSEGSLQGVRGLITAVT